LFFRSVDLNSISANINPKCWGIQSVIIHHLYGSSRLGIATYDSTQYRSVWGPAVGPTPAGLRDSSLNTRVAWLSQGHQTWIRQDRAQVMTGSTLNRYADTIMELHKLGRKLYEFTDHLGNTLAITLDKKKGFGNDGGYYVGYYPELLALNDYYPFGMLMPDRNPAAGNGYRFGFNGQEKTDEVYGKGNLNTALFWEYDTRIARRWNVDPKAALLPSWSPYVFCKDNPIIYIDPDGQFPIFINGRVSKDSERGSWTYWDKSVRETVKTQTGYYHSQFMYVDGDKGTWPSKRASAGMTQGTTDAAEVYARMKENMVDGKIVEQLQVISHSRGGAFANAYMQGLTTEIQNLAAADKIEFAYGADNIVQYSVNLAPHQSNYINYPNTGTMNVNISHIGDPLSGNDATGNVINVHSIPEKDAFDQHGNATYNTELNFILNILENNTNKSNLLNEVKAGYRNYDNSRTNGDKSKVTSGK
jgi:RHS repeat-associated protein